MPLESHPLSFEATAQKGRVSALWLQPSGAVATLVFGHGAGAGMRHAHMQAIAESLAAQRIATLRFNFPFMEAGGGRTDSRPVCIETIGHAIDAARGLAAGSCILLGGHSFGGRMASHFAAENDTLVEGLVYYSFPLHPARKPDTRRADHLGAIAKPQLFLSGTRDALADLALLRGVMRGLPHAKLHELETADHSFKILKRTRSSTEDVYTEAARGVADFISGIAAH